MDLNNEDLVNKKSIENFVNEQEYLIDESVKYLTKELISNHCIVNGDDENWDTECDNIQDGINKLRKDEYELDMLYDSLDVIYQLKNKYGIRK